MRYCPTGTCILNLGDYNWNIISMGRNALWPLSARGSFHLNVYVKFKMWAQRCRLDAERFERSGRNVSSVRLRSIRFELSTCRFDKLVNRLVSTFGVISISSASADSCVTSFEIRLKFINFEDKLNFPRCPLEALVTLLLEGAIKTPL